jgi:hypothetical protein
MSAKLRQALRASDLFILLTLAVVIVAAVWRFKPWRLEIAMVGGFIIFALLLWRVLSLYLNANAYSERKDFIDLHAKILGSAALIISLLFTWQGIKLNQTTSETTQRLSLMSLQDAERRQIDDRFNRALEQLGSDKREARLGAIYSLGKIAADSIELKAKSDAIGAAGQESRDSSPLVKNSVDFHWSIMQTLASYARGNAPINKNNTRRPEAMATDIQAALDVLAWRGRTYLNGEDQRLELHGTDLRFAMLKDKEIVSKDSVTREGAHFEGAQLYDVDLEKANLRGIHLEGAILKNAKLKDADLSGAYLAGADLAGADLEGTKLAKATGLTPVGIYLSKNQGEKIKEIDDELKKNLQAYADKLRKLQQ